MPTLIESLREYREPLPEWLEGEGEMAFDPQQFVSSRTVYYPGCGYDGHPVKLCTESRVAHAFVYVDYAVGEKRVVACIADPEGEFYGYEVTHTEHVDEETLYPGGWTPHLAPDEVANTQAFYNANPDWFATRFARFYVLTRKEGFGDDHGARRLAILFVGGDGFAIYDALYCQGDGSRAPFMILTHDHSAIGRWASFGRDGIPGHEDGLLERLAERCGVVPNFLLIGRGTEPWIHYEDIGAAPHPGGIHGRSLYRRRRQV